MSSQWSYLAEARAADPVEILAEMVFVEAQDRQHAAVKGNATVRYRTIVLAENGLSHRGRARAWPFMARRNKKKD